MANTKPFKLTELMARLHALVRGATAASSHCQPASLRRAGGQPLDLKEAFREGHPVKLTIREFKLLEFFMRHPGKAPFPSFELLEKVWGLDFDTGTNVVTCMSTTYATRSTKDFPTNSSIRLWYGVYILKKV